MIFGAAASPPMAGAAASPRATRAAVIEVMPMAVTGDANGCHIKRTMHDVWPRLHRYVRWGRSEERLG